MPKKQRKSYDPKAFPDPLQATVARLQALLEQLENEKGNRVIALKSIRHSIPCFAACATACPT